MRSLIQAIVVVAALATPVAALSGSASIAQDANVASGVFRDADAVHTGSGMATITEAASGALMLTLQNFKTIPGPDLKVLLLRASNIKSSGDVTKSEFLTLGPLVSSSGDQSYLIPAGTEVANYASVAIWCETYGVLFTAADLAQ
jgi:hypothetical protein